MVKPTYTESELKTILACSKLYKLGGSVNNFDDSQNFVRYTFQLLILKILKGEIQDIDVTINQCVSLAYNKIYNKAQQDEEYIIKLKEYAFSFINNFLLNFPLKKYDLVLGPNHPLLKFEAANVKLSVDAVFKRKNRKKFLDIVCIVPFLDDHLLNNDFTINMKTEYYKQYTSTSFSKSIYSEVVIHLFSTAKFNFFRSRKHPHSFIYKKKGTKDVSPIDYNPILEQVNVLSNYSLPHPVCPNRKCSMRKECNS